MGKKNQINKTSAPTVVAEKLVANNTASPQSLSNSKVLSWIIGLFLFLAAFILYSNTFSHRFVLDDHGIIKNNKYTKAALSWENTKAIFSTPLRRGDVSDLENSLYRPMVKMLFNVEWNAFNGNPFYFHRINVLLYALTCFFIFIVLYDMFKKKWVLPFLITLLFLVHPLHVESVANVKSADEILSLLGIVIALRCIQVFIKNNKKLYLILAALAFLMGSFSKESTIVALAIFPLFIYYYTEADGRKNGTISIVMAACSVFFLICRFFALRGYPEPSPLSLMDNYLVDCPNKASQIVSAINTLGLYLKTFFIPHPLSCDYSFSSLKPVTTDDPYTLLSFIASFLILTALFVYAIMKLKEKESWAFGVLWFFISISIVSNVFILIGTSFGERLMFTPSLGLCIAFVMVLAKFFYKGQDVGNGFFKQLKSSPILFAIILVVSVLYSYKTYSRNENWKTDFKLFSRDIEYYPESTHLLFYMGNHLSGNERKEVLNYEMTELDFNFKQIADSQVIENSKSIYYLNRSLQIYPQLPSDGYNQLGKAYYNNGQIDSAEKYYKMALERDPDNGIFINNLGTVYYNLAQQDVPAITYYMRAGKMDSANLFYKRRIDNVIKSRGYFIKAAKRDTTEADFSNNIACSYGDLAIYDSAAYWFNKSILIDPIDTTALKFMEATLYNLKTAKDSASAKTYHQQYMDAKAEHLRKLSE
jgi:protein O-mannosyl-transferase